MSDDRLWIGRTVRRDGKLYDVVDVNEDGVLHLKAKQQPAGRRHDLTGDMHATQAEVEVVPQQRTYRDGARVDVWRKKLQALVPGTVLGAVERDGAWRYLVQLDGYTAAQADDPNCWFTALELQPAE